jgi:hypothetical protein
LSETAATRAEFAHPIDRVEWVHVDDLRPNGWNPNRVMDLELALLERSIASLGWAFPVIVSRSGIIIDGFHRWSVARKSPALRQRDHGMIPVVRLDVDDAQAKAITVRMNRAKGEHGALAMSDLVRSLSTEHGWQKSQIADAIGAAPGEVDLLLDRSLFIARKLGGHVYGEAWEPAPAKDCVGNEPKRQATPGRRKVARKRK